MANVKRVFYFGNGIEYPNDPRIPYKYPSWLPTESQPEEQPTVRISREEIVAAAQMGVTWEQLEAYYTVDIDTLKRIFLIDYRKAEAQLQINILDSMIKSAVEGSPIMLKWLSTNLLGMTEKNTTLVDPNADKPIDDDAITAKIKALLEKYKV